MPDNQISVGGRQIEVRGLTRKEVKELAEDGLNLGALPRSLAEQAVDAVFKRVLSQDDTDYLDGLVNAEAVRVYRRIMDLTYGSGEEEKNS
ncbi:ferritin-like protein [Desulfosalsimonas propionicica]|uniref:Ferritin-like protein n=1 Tax=Desulfosalsimonas propionicica TaxID=332175 RepID=A0A7W0C9V7_9BACT|nr:hypothetical protein [Desulfosalsimonas propionicica]MBA2881833.1 ferritin-like protein [Desulfosalsimonas propionicica]